RIIERSDVEVGKVEIRLAVGSRVLGDPVTECGQSGAHHATSTLPGPLHEIGQRRRTVGAEIPHHAVFQGIVVGRDGTGRVVSAIEPRVERDVSRFAMFAPHPARWNVDETAARAAESKPRVSWPAWDV